MNDLLPPTTPSVKHHQQPPTGVRRSLAITFWQSCVRWFFRIMLLTFYRIRVYGLENYPEDDGALICANHQSNLDPLVMGVACPRPTNYLAKESLFHFGPLGWFLSWNDAIPIDRHKSALGGMKETLRRLKKGESVVLFPEGSRSLDGGMRPLMPGFCSLARRTSATLVPVGIDGTFDALPPKARWPRLGRIAIVFGEPIESDDYADLDDEALVEALRERIAGCLNLASAKRRGG